MDGEAGWIDREGEWISLLQSWSIFTSEDAVISSNINP